MVGYGFLDTGGSRVQMKLNGLIKSVKIRCCQKNSNLLDEHINHCIGRRKPLRRFSLVFYGVIIGISWHSNNTHQPFLSARPRHSSSVLTMYSINFFHNIPSLMTRFHSLQTRSAEQSDLASKYPSTFSATWSNPFSVKLTKPALMITQKYQKCRQYKTLLLLETLHTQLEHQHSTYAHQCVVGLMAWVYVDCPLINFWEDWWRGSPSDTYDS